MSGQHQLDEWTTIIHTHLPRLSKPQATVLAISVVSRGCAIPVAWTILPATTKHAWRRHWLQMRHQLRPALPRGWTVMGLADRGL